jgi:hypothetical protein
MYMYTGRGGDKVITVSLKYKAVPFSLHSDSEYTWFLQERLRYAKLSIESDATMATS